MNKPRKSKLTTRVHFNRINMQRKSPAVWTVHNSRGCFQGEKVLITRDGAVVAETVFRPDGPQPRAYLLVRGHIEQDQDGTVVVEI